MGIDLVGGWPAVLRPLLQGHDLAKGTAHAVMAEILAGTASSAQIAAFIVGLRMKGETVDEMTEMVHALYEAATPLPLGELADSAIDIVGTGGGHGRQAAALNVSTMACFVAAGAGATVCKHGNRKASSTSGSFDFLDAIGVPDALSPAMVQRCVRDAGIGFAFARTFHPAMRFCAPVRAELGVPTVFNVLGPLANPAHVRRQVIGVNDPARAIDMARVLQATGSVHSMVVSGHGGLDELALSGPSHIVELVDGTIRSYDITPEAIGVTPAAGGPTPGGDAAENKLLFEALLDGKPGPVREIVVLNAAAGLVVAGLATDLVAGVTSAQASIDSGNAAVAYRRLLDVVRTASA